MMQSIFMDIMPSLHFTGLVLAVGTFLIIGLFHPIVIKIEYHSALACGGCSCLQA